MRLSFTQESDFRQQRDFGQKITATFEFISAHWRGLGRALLFIVVPAALLQGILGGIMQKELLMDGARRSGRAGGLLENLSRASELTGSPYYWLNIILSAVFVTLLVLTVYGYLRLCLRPTPTAEPISTGEVWAEVKAKFLESFLSYFGLLIVVIVGYFLFVIPGIYLSVVLTLFYIVLMVENTNFGATLSRCRHLARGKWWSTFGLLFIMTLMLGICSGVIGGVIGGIIGGIGGALGLYQAGGTNSFLSVLAIATSTLTGLLSMFFYPPLFIAIAFQYFNLVERHDAIGLRNMVSQLGQAPATASTAAAYRPDEEGEY
jgi:MFS family permease